jgi:hypothetical protein
MNHDRDFGDTEPSRPMPLDPLAQPARKSKPAPIAKWTSRDEKRLIELTVRKRKVEMARMSYLESVLADIGIANLLAESNRGILALRMSKHADRLIKALRAVAQNGKES